MPRTLLSCAVHLFFALCLLQLHVCAQGAAHNTCKGDTTGYAASMVQVLTPEVREAIVKNIKRRMTPQPLKIRADVELTCFSYDGVLHIQVRWEWRPAQGCSWASMVPVQSCPVPIRSQVRPPEG